MELSPIISANEIVETLNSMGAGSNQSASVRARISSACPGAAFVCVDPIGANSSGVGFCEELVVFRARSAPSFSAPRRLGGGVDEKVARSGSGADGVGLLEQEPGIASGSLAAGLSEARSLSAICILSANEAAPASGDSVESGEGRADGSARSSARGPGSSPPRRGDRVFLMASRWDSFGWIFGAVRRERRRVWFRPRPVWRGSRSGPRPRIPS